MITDWKLIQNKDGSYSIYIESENNHGQKDFAYINESELTDMLYAIRNPSEVFM